MEEAKNRVCLLWIKALSPLYTNLSANIAREICLYFPLHFPLIWLENETFKLLNLDTQDLGPSLRLSRKITTFNASWLAVDSSRIFACEGGANGKFQSDHVLRTAVFVHVNGQVEDVCDMIFEHNNPGLVVWKGNIYVFGSYAGTGVTKCEGLELKRNSAWRAGPDMQSRRTLFTPAVWRSSVYLCGGENNASIECFDGAEMRLLNARLPEQSYTLVCLHNDSLLVLTRSYTVAVCMERGESEPQVTIVQKEPHNCQVYTNPVVWKEMVINIAWETVAVYSAANGHLIT